MSYKLGDRVSMIPQTFGTGIEKPGESASHTKAELKKNIKPLPGTVTFVNKRWYQVTFDCGISECFFKPVSEQPEREKRNRSRLYGGFVN